MAADRAVGIVNRVLVAIGGAAGLGVGVLRESVLAGLVSAAVVTFTVGSALFLVIVIGLAVSDLVRVVWRLDRSVRDALRFLFGDHPRGEPIPAAVTLGRGEARRRKSDPRGI